MRADLYTRAENLQSGTAAGENSLTAAFPCRVKRFSPGVGTLLTLFITVARGMYSGAQAPGLGVSGSTF